MKTRWLASSMLAACLGTAAGTSTANESTEVAGPAANLGADPDAATDASQAAASPRAERLRIVLDPGHGGTNTGARGAVEGLLEKRVTLAVSQLLAEELRAAGFEVSLTRQVDRTLTLRQRSELANRAGADLFVSIHANASPSRSQRGFETYVLTPTGVDVIAPALRNGEPAPRPRHPGRPDVAAEIAGILDDVERGATQWEAADLAAAVQSSLREVRGRERDRGVRQDAHHVLLGATMPAVLVEIGFVDHPVEGRELALPGTQRAVASAIASAILHQTEAAR